MDDEFLLDTPQLRSFIADVQQVISQAPSVEVALAGLRQPFNRLLADPTWLPEAFRQPDATSGMGGGIAAWLLYRANDGNLSLFALVVPPGASTPIHDHLAWGLIGLYAGEQAEEVYARADGDDPSQHEHVPLQLVATNHLRAGEFYELIPPDGDIHRVTTTSATPSISLHLLGNDTGCVWRHRYDVEAARAEPFRSGYTNRPCTIEEHG